LVFIGLTTLLILIFIYSRTDSTAIDSSCKERDIYYVSAIKLNFRLTPDSRKNNIVEELPKGHAVCFLNKSIQNNSLNKSVHWWFVKNMKNTNTGWVNSCYLAKESSISNKSANQIC
jgi:hypothetical protein